MEKPEMPHVLCRNPDMSRHLPPVLPTTSVQQVWDDIVNNHCAYEPIQLPRHTWQKAAICAWGPAFCTSSAGEGRRPNLGSKACGWLLREEWQIQSWSWWVGKTQDFVQSYKKHVFQMTMNLYISEFVKIVLLVNWLFMARPGPLVKDLKWPFLSNTEIGDIK